MKKGRASMVGLSLVAWLWRVVLWGGASGAHLSLASSFGRTRMIGVRSGAHLLNGPSGGQGVGGASGSEGFVAAEHVPDRFGESAGEVDLGDLGAALLADAGFGLLVAVAVGR